MSDSKGAAIDEILNRVFRYGLEVGKLNKDYQTLNESIDAKAEKQAILALLAQEVKRVIGEDEPRPVGAYISPETLFADKEKEIRNQLRAEQRKAGLV